MQVFSLATVESYPLGTAFLKMNGAETVKLEPFHIRNAWLIYIADAGLRRATNCPSSQESFLPKIDPFKPQVREPEPLLSYPELTVS